MDTFSTSDLRRLTTAQQGPCVSIFMPTHAAGRDGQQDALRLKNLLAQAERGLVEQGLRVPDIKQLLEPVRELPAESGFWEKRSLGLAVFVTEGLLNRFRVPLPLDEMVVVNRRFQIKPLLPLIGANDQYFVLALSQNRVRLLEGRQFGMQEVKVDGLPKDMAQFLNYDSSERPSLAHAAPRSQPGKSSAVVHSLGGEREPAKDELAQYFRAIDAGLRETLRDQRAPLILAGVQYLLPIYREVSSYAFIAKDEVAGKSRSSLGARVAQPHLAADQVPCRGRPAGGSRQVSEAGGHGQDVRTISARSCRRRIRARSNCCLWIGRRIAGASSTQPPARSPSARQRPNVATTTSSISPPCRRCCTAAPCMPSRRTRSRRRRRWPCCATVTSSGSDVGGWVRRARTG